ncbi:MAG: hypothetical protein PHW34_11880 [Hespellia sp.]|nr:hypothetical protein [Hespellia sp.]
MNREKRSYPVIHIGTSFLLVIFVVLCLVVFAALSLSSALRDQSYVEMEADRTIAYYEANAKAQEMLRDAVTDFRDSGKASDEISYSVPIDDSQSLEVTVLLGVPDDPGEPEGQTLRTSVPGGQTLRIIKWKKVNSGEWTADTTLPVLKGDD